MLSIRLAIVTVSLLIIGPLLARAGVIAPLHGFLVFIFSGLCASLTLVTGIVAGIRGYRKGYLAAVIALIPLAVLAKGVVGNKFPRINDVTTDLSDPPHFTSARTANDNINKDQTFPREFIDSIQTGYPNLKPLTLPIPPNAAFKRIEKAMASQVGWTLKHSDEASGMIEAETTGGIFRFVDDIVVRIRPEGSGSRIDARSRSRVGKGDFGANAARIQNLFSRLREDL